MIVVGTFLILLASAGLFKVKKYEFKEDQVRLTIACVGLIVIGIILLIIGN